MALVTAELSIGVENAPFKVENLMPAWWMSGDIGAVIDCGTVIICGVGMKQVMNSCSRLVDGMHRV